MIKINLKYTSIEYNNFIIYLKSFTNSNDRYIKGHAKDLLTRLQALNPQDDNN